MMNEYNNNKNFLYQNDLVNENEIYELDGNPEEDEYIQLFNFYKSNLTHLEVKFGCSPSYFYIRNEDEINAKARKRNNCYTVGINHKVLNTLFTKYKTYFEIPSIDGLENYIELQDILTNDLHDLIYQAVLHFNFYHEWAHLLQFKAEAENEISFYNPSTEYDEFSHLAEIDADCVSAHSCSSHFYQYLVNHTTQIPTREQAESFLSLVSSAMVIYISEFMEDFDVFYLNDRMYPHPSIRVCNISKEIAGYFLHVQKMKDVPSSNHIRISEIGKECRRVSKILSTHFRTDSKYNRIEELIRVNIKPIAAYLHNAMIKININPNSAINQRKNSIY